LKSAAKRFKINYSSAKSILHTFRKEGRILKKSAQERTIKKKPESMLELDTTPKSSRLLKKTPIQVDKEKASKSLTSLAVKGAFSKETTPVGSLSRLDEGAYEQNHHYTQGGMVEEANAFARKSSYHHDDQHYNSMTYYRGYNDNTTHPHQEVGRNYMFTEGLEHHGNYDMHYGRGYESSYNDMVSALQHRPGQVDEYFSDPSATFMHHREVNAHHIEDKYLKHEHVGEYHDHHDAGFNPFRSFMDSQSTLKDALMKATHASYSNSNNVGFRKSSIDMF